MRMLVRSSSKKQNLDVKFGRNVRYAYNLESLQPINFAAENCYGVPRERIEFELIAIWQGTANGGYWLRTQSFL